MLCFFLLDLLLCGGGGGLLSICNRAAACNFFEYAVKMAETVIGELVADFERARVGVP